MRYKVALGVGLAILGSIGVYALPTQNPTKVVRVGIYQNPPKVFQDTKGHPTGFWVDVLESIAQQENWSLGYISCQWEKCLKKIEQGQLDLMVDVAYSEKRDRRFDFNQEVVLTSWSVVYRRKGLTLNSVLDLDKKKVAILEDSIQHNTLEQYTKQFNITPQFIPVDSFSEMFQSLEQGKVDAGAVNHFFGQQIAPQYDVVKTNIIFNPSRLHFVVAEGENKHLLTAIDRQLETLTKDGNSAYYQALNRWLTPKKRFDWLELRHLLIEFLIYLPLVGFVGFALWNYALKREIQQRKKAEQALQKSEQRFMNMAANVPGAIFQYVLHPDGSDQVTYMSPGCYELWEVEAPEVVEDASILWAMVHPDDRSAMYESVLHSAETLTPWRWQWRITTPSGQLKWLEASGRPERHENGDTVWDSLIMDVSDRIEMEQALQHKALHDELTGLPNRLLLMERLDLVLKRLKHHSNLTFAVLFLDLDHFKVVNDSLGHGMGDYLLFTVGQLLNQFIRETDLAARLGGDEFVILLEEVEDLEDAVRVAERILETLRSPLLIAEREVFISSSIGIVWGTPHYHSPEDLLRDADLAMYRAKHNGRGRYALFDPAMHASVVQRLQIENDLRKALEQKEFCVYYQPIIHLESQQIRGFEALIRWQHPQRGFISPDTFIAIAEETGLVVPMGHWILHTASEQLAQWQAQFPEKPLKMSVNLSVRQLQPQLLQTLENVLRRYPLPPKSLVLEITESMLVQNVERTGELLEHIKAKNIGISIDDFGTGYSSLSYLHRLPVDALKIDRAFVSPRANDARNQIIAESIIALSNLLELNAIAEGIETLQQLEWLKTLGCELGQGFFFSRPLSPEQATQFLNQTVSSFIKS